MAALAPWAISGSTQLGGNGRGSPISLQTPESFPSWDPVTCGLLLYTDVEYQDRSFSELPSRRNQA